MLNRLIKKYLEELARYLRNQSSYDDWDYATEPIPGDKTWVKKKGKCKTCSGKCSIKDTEGTTE